MANITLSLDEYKALEKRITEAEAAVAHLQSEIAAVRLQDPNINQLNSLARSMLVIVRFAVANLPPSEIRGWPWQVLEDVATQLSTLPNSTTDDDVLAHELKAFVRDIQIADKEAEQVRMTREAERRAKREAERQAFLAESQKPVT